MDTQTNTAADSLAEILHALRGIRAPIQQGEYDLHDLVRASLAEAEIPCAHEVRSLRAAASTLCAPAASASKSSAAT